MRQFKSIYLSAALGAGACIALSASAFAYTPSAGQSTSIRTATGAISYSNVLQPQLNTHHNKRIGKASETASKYYRFGVTYFEAGKLDKAEAAFKAILRANGLNQEANLYLARISEAQGKTAQAEAYARAYHGL